MAVEIRFSESATADLEDLVSWYAERGAAEVGGRLARELLERVVHPPFRIVYRCDRNAVRVVRGWRGQRLLRHSHE